MHESAPGQRPERGPAHVGVCPVLKVIEQVQQDDRVAILAVDLEDSLHRVAPAEQHLPVRRLQVRPAGHEPVHHGLAVRQAVLQREPVDGADRVALIDLLQAGLQHGRGQRPLPARAAREVDQAPLQFRAALDEDREILPIAAAVHAGSRPSAASRRLASFMPNGVGSQGSSSDPVLDGRVAPKLQPRRVAKTFHGVHTGTLLASGSTWTGQALGGVSCPGSSGRSPERRCWCSGWRPGDADLAGADRLRRW